MIAVAAVIAGVGLLMSQPPAPARPAAPRAAPVQRPVSSAVAAWLAWWQRILASHRGGGLGIGHGGLHRLRRR